MKQKLLLSYYRLLASLARHYLHKHKPYIIGINGSVGKTSCRMIIYQTLKRFFPELKISTSKKNFNGELWLSLSIFEIDERNPTIWTFISVLRKITKQTLFGPRPYDIIILEYGIDRPLEMEFLLDIAKPHIWVFTAIDSVHSEQFGNPAEIAKEEVKMIQNTLEIWFLNANDPYALQVKNRLKIDHLNYQTAGHDIISDIKFEKEKFFLWDLQWSLGVWFDLHIKKNVHHIKTNILGKANYGYIGVALTIAEIVSRKPQFSKHRLQLPSDLTLEYELQPGRLSIFPGIEESIIIDSSYNASPLSIRKIINTVHNIREQLFPQRKVWMLLGDMRELGDLTETEHRMISGYVSQVADRVFLVGDHMKNFLADELIKIGYPAEKIYTFTKSTQAADTIKTMLAESGNECLIVCKWSQNTIFIEEAVKKLLANPADEYKLTRQSHRWMQKKKEFFQ